MTKNSETIKKLSHKDAFAFHSGVLSTYEANEKIAKSSVFIIYRQAVEAFEKAWDQALAKRTSYELKQAEKQRQRIYACFSASVRSGKSHPDDSIREASLQIAKLLDNERGLHALCSLHNDESLWQVLREIKTGDRRNTLSVLGALTWLEELEHINTTSKEIRDFHMDELQSHGLRSLRKKRDEMEMAYQAFITSFVKDNHTPEPES